MPVERTFVLLKPDAVQRGLTFEVSERFEKRGLTLAACRMQQPPQGTLEKHCEALKGSAGYDAYLAFLTAGPVVAQVWEGADAVAAAVATVGDADPVRAANGTIRGDLAVDPARNLVDCAASKAEAARSIALWFKPEELVSAAAPGPSAPAAPAKVSGAAKAVAAKAAAPAAAGAAAAGEAAGASTEGLSKRAAAKEAKKAEKAAAKAAHQAAAGAAKGQKQTSGHTVTEHVEVGRAIETEPPSGTRDFFPEQMRLQNWLFGHFRATARRFAFQEYDAPVLENEELYKRKGGEEITEQMYNFVDKDGKNVTLRPEMTPSLARMILSLGGKVLLPVKWFSLPQCWRFETVQRGRKREHYQWNMDIIGEKSVAAEIELLAAVVDFFRAIGITSADVGLKVNSRRVLSAILTKFSIAPDQFPYVCVIVDKLDKIGADAVVELLLGQGVEEAAGRQIVASLSLKSVDELKALMGDTDDGGAVDELVTIFEMAEAYGFADWILFDASVVRGLSYYTGIVFEGFDRRGELRAICGGGRYDKLLSLYGSPEVVPACGFGFGDCVVIELLKERGLLPTLEPEVDFVVAPYNAELRAAAAKVAALLRGAGFAVDVLLEPAKKVKKAFEYADRVRGNRVFFVAPDEWASGKVRMKDLRSGSADDKEVDLPLDGLIAALAEMGITSSAK